MWSTLRGSTKGEERGESEKAGYDGYVRTARHPVYSACCMLLSLSLSLQSVSSAAAGLGSTVQPRDMPPALARLTPSTIHPTNPTNHCEGARWSR